MKINKLFMGLAAMAFVGCSSDDLNLIAPEQAAEDSRLVELNSNFVLAGIGEESSGTRTHWEMVSGSLKNKFLPILSDASGAGELLSDNVYSDPDNYPIEAVGLCWLGEAGGEKVYTNYQFYHYGWLKTGETDATIECEDLKNGAWYDEIKFNAGGLTAGNEADETDFALDVAKDFAIGDLNWNSGVYKTDNKAIFGGKYIVYYPFNKDFNEVGTIPAKARTSFSPVPTTLTDPALGDATFRYSAPIEIKGGDQAGGFGLYNLSALVQLKVTGSSDGYGIDQIVLWSKKEQLLEQANLAADKIVAGKKGTELYAETKGTKTIVAALGTAYAVAETAPVNVYITALPTKVEDLVAFVHRTDGTWATKELGAVEFEPNSGKLVKINVAADDFEQKFIAVDDATLRTALAEATGLTATIEVIGDITLTTDLAINEPTVTIKGDDIIVPENVTLTVNTKMESDVRVLGKACCTNTAFNGGRLVVSGGELGNVTMEPAKATVTAAIYDQYNPAVTYDGAATIAAGKTFDAQAGNIIVNDPVEHKGNLNIAEGVKLTVVGTEDGENGDLNFMGSTVVNAGTIEVLKGAKFDITDSDGNASWSDGQNMTNTGEFIHNVDAEVGTAVQNMKQEGTYRCRVDKQVKLDDAYQKWLACSVIEMVGTGQNYNLGVAEKNINYKHNDKYIDIEVNATGNTTFTNPDLGSGDGDNKNIQVGNLTIMQGTTRIKFVTGEGQRSLTVNGDMDVQSVAAIWHSKKVTITENLTVEGGVFKYYGDKANVEGLAVGKDITVSAATFNADDVDALNITCANFTLTDGATAKFGNRTEGDTKNLTVSGTIDNSDAASSFEIHTANQDGNGSVLATITCTKLLVGGAFPGGKPQVVK
jgi:hypothetical protein